MGKKVEIPEDIIINHIMPYTYQKQSEDLLLDIKTFCQDFEIIKNIYVYSYNYSILLYDLILFCNDFIFIHEIVSEKFKNILMRHYVLSNYTNNRINLFVYENYHENKRRKNIMLRIKFLWGLLTRFERTRFINIHIDL
jgi:hypothetical protein